MNEKQNEWSPKWLLEAWGLRAFGALTTPWKVLTGGTAISDDESQAAWYVEHTEGFERARDVLAWRYRFCRELVDFPVRDPGETLVRALLRRSWGAMLGRRPYQIARAIHDEFLDALVERVRREPFRPIRPVEIEDPIELAAAQNARYPVRESIRQAAYCCETVSEFA